MLARIWRGIVRASTSDAYLRYLREQIIPIYRRADGSRAVFILHDAQGEFSVFLLLSFWESRAVLEQFADPLLKSETSRQEREFLLAFESTAAVYEIISPD
jgi:heme-degrading monooxygenase HmoA